MSEPAAHGTDGFITRLPDSILLEIFKHLNVRDLGIAAGVCKRWHMLSHDPVLRLCLDVTFIPLTAMRIWYLLRSQVAPSMRELHVRGCFLYRSRWGTHASSFHSLSPSLSSFTLPELCHRCPALQGLFLSDMALALDTNGQVPTLGNFPPTLRSLGMRGCLFQPAPFFSEDPSQLVSRLRFLDLSSCIQVDACVLGHLEARATSLRALGLERCARIDSGGMLRLQRLLENLACLDLEATALDDTGLAHVLRHARSLETLFVGNTSATGRPFSALPRGWLTKLRRLCVCNTEVRFGDLPEVARVAPALRRLIASADEPAEVPREFRESMPNCEVVRRALPRDETCGHFLEAAVRRYGCCP
ncbi:F-box/LRR-repeat protein 12 [Ixodes scapularis]